MEGEGVVQFLPQKSNVPTCCAFHPKARYAFAFGGSEGEVTLVSALRGEVVRTISIGSLNLARAINSLTFSPDGSKAITSSVSRKVVLMDVERGTTLLAYDNCVSPLKARQPLATHPALPNLAACPAVNSRGITLFDLRMPLPLDFIYDLHEDTIHDLFFLDGSWPWGSGKAVLVSGSAAGEIKVNGLDGRPLCSFSTQPPITLLHPSPDRFNAALSSGYPSVVLVNSGEGLVSWGVGKKPWKLEAEKIHPPGVTRIKYSQSGGILYTAQGHAVHRRRRYPDHHQDLGQVFSHSGAIRDMDLSPYNEYLITASQDSTIGLLHLGAPNHGWTHKYEFT